MECKKCGRSISGLIAAETILKVVAICEGLGVARPAIPALVDQQAPLCRTCMTNWGAGEDDFQGNFELS